MQNDFQVPAYSRQVDLDIFAEMGHKSREQAPGW